MQEPYVTVNPSAPEPEFLLTVVTVCWNALKDLKPTVESVLRQKAKGSISIEHVVVDGASTDGTPEWLEQQLAAGSIERYVSEPDRGIYDAMNKGINLARGQVLAFLNAGDMYTDEDLAACVLPICRGETHCVAACANWVNSPGMQYYLPSYWQLYFGCPCCHQAYFASARAYRELGGYDCSFRCSADTDMMYAMYRRWGKPMISECIVADFAAGGISSNSTDDFRDEHIEARWRNWDLIEQRCLREPDFKMAMETYLANHCYQLHNWQQRHGKMIPDKIGKLQSMCRKLAPHARNLYAKCALRWLAGHFLPVLAAGREPSHSQLRLARFWCHACHLPEGNKYGEYFWTPIKPLNLRGLLKGILHRIVKPGR